MDEEKINSPATLPSTSAGNTVDTGERISDDQELFLKVLENLKNAVNLKPDKHSIALPKQQTIEQHYHATKIEDLNPNRIKISSTESPARSDVIEPAISSETFSNQTKSVDLQNITVSKEQGEIKIGVPESFSKTLNTTFDSGSLILSCESEGKLSQINNDIITEKDVVTQGETNTSRTEVIDKADYSYKTLEKVKIVTPSTVRPVAPAPAKQLYTCNLCDYYSENKNYLKQHMDLVHNNDRPFKCPFCEYAGKRSHALREHLIVHSNERPYQCQSCNATFRKKGHLTNHVKLHNSKRLVKCPLCKMLIYDVGENGLDSHLKNEHDTERLYGCDLCDYVAANEPEMLTHLRSKHKSKVVAFKCDRCPFQTSNTSDFNAHMDAHKMVNLKVKIKDDNPCDVVAVATLPASETGPELPNTAVTFESKDKTSSQAAVIKPVWIKCSECGFTAQDSEVIKKHMLEHLGMEVTEDPKQHVQQILAPLNSSLKQNSQPVSSVSVTKPSVLIPVTNVDNLFSQQAGKLNLNSPILVPVSNTAMLKSLQTIPISGLPQSMQSKVIQIDPSVVTTAVASNMVQQTARPVSSKTFTTSASNPQLNIAKDTCLNVTPSLTVPSSLTSMTPKQPIIPLQKYQIEQLLKNPNLKVIPVAGPQASVSVTPSSSVIRSSFTPMNTPPTSVIKSNTIPIVHVPGSSSIPFVHVAGSKEAKTHLSEELRSQTASSNRNTSQPTAGFKTNQIPVPRNLTIIPPPKLPPDIASLDFPVIEGSRNKSSQSKESEQSADNTVAVLRENLVNIQQLIEEQNKLNKRLGQPVIKLDAQGLPETIDKQKVVYYVSPIEKQSTTAKNVKNAGFTHDSNAGRFRCTLCGYTCEYQRTIKAHVWKHSGNKDIEYPMFQNGPLSIYDDGNYAKTEVEETNEILEEEYIREEVVWSECENTTGISQASIDAKTNQTGNSKLPPFIVYDQTRISNVAPALANLLAARTMANMSKTKKADNDESVEPDNKKLNGQETSRENLDENGKCSVNPEVQEHDMSGLTTKQPLKITENVNIIVDAEQLNAMHRINSVTVDSVSADTDKSPDQSKTKSNIVVESANVVVEAVNSVNTSCGYTGLQSQQNSPWITPAPRSPDSGVSELTSTSRTADEKSSSEFMSPVPSLEHIGGTEAVQSRLGKRKLEEGSVELIPSEECCETKKTKSQSLEDSAVTLLSLLKKGPNYNPACPPKTGNVSSVGDTVSVPSPGQEDSNSTGDMESKPKSGISTSLLAVIEQLRERSKSDLDEEKPLPVFSSKKTSKRRSRRSSVEGNESAEGIENVEQFEVDGLVKFRCKLCHYTNDSTVLLKQHMRMHKPKQEFECSLCDLIAESSEALQDHMIQHCKVRTYQCKLCNSAFNYKSQLRAHMRMHNEPYLLLCEYCDFETRSAATLKTHIKTHLTKPPYKCDICKEQFITSFNLRIHKREGCYTSIDRLGQFKCDKCDYTAVGRREMKNHHRVHLVRNVIQQEKDCPYCDFTGVNVLQTQQHIADIHGESKPLKCEMCGFVAVSIRSLKSHMKRHVNDQRYVAQPLEQYKCNLCGYVCHHLPSLKSHMWRHAADQHYSYEFTNDIINAAIDFDSLIDAADTTENHVSNFKKLIFEKMKAKGLEGTGNTQEESASVCCWVTFRCCQCGFETINKAELNMHMTAHSDVIKWTLDVSEEENKQEEVPMVIQEQVVPFVETNNAFPQIMNA